jgi:hypothetical protein
VTRLSRISAFLSAHKTALSQVGGLFSVVVVTFLGSGFLSQYASMRAERERTAHERLELEASLLADLYEYETAIQQLAPKYAAARDRLSGKTRQGDRLAYDELRNQLTALFAHYNILEAKVSQFEERDPQFMLPAGLIPPQKSAKLKLQADDVERAVSHELASLLDQYPEPSRKALYRRWCKAGAGYLCTRLAIRQFKSRVNRTLEPEDRELLTQGCSLRDFVGCELLAHDDFHRGDYASTERWLTKACDLSSGPGCGFLGTLYKSRLLGEKHDPERARLHLEKGCTLRSNRSCYYLAILYVSGLVKRNEKAALDRLQAACWLNLNQACKSLDQFEEFKTCSPSALPALAGDVIVAVQCKQREKRTRSAGGPSETGIGRSSDAVICS